MDASRLETVTLIGAIRLKMTNRVTLLEVAQPWTASPLHEVAYCPD